MSIIKILDTATYLKQFSNQPKSLELVAEGLTHKFEKGDWFNVVSYIKPESAIPNAQLRWSVSENIDYIQSSELEITCYGSIEGEFFVTAETKNKLTATVTGTIVKRQVRDLSWSNGTIQLIGKEINTISLYTTYDAVKDDNAPILYLIDNSSKEKIEITYPYDFYGSVIKINHLEEIGDGSNIEIQLQLSGVSVGNPTYTLRAESYNEIEERTLSCDLEISLDGNIITGFDVVPSSISGAPGEIISVSITPIYEFGSNISSTYTWSYDINDSNICQWNSDGELQLLKDGNTSISVYCCENGSANINIPVNVSTPITNDYEFHIDAVIPSDWRNVTATVNGENVSVPDLVYAVNLTYEQLKSYYTDYNIEYSYEYFDGKNWVSVPTNRTTVKSTELPPYSEDVKIIQYSVHLY